MTTAVITHEACLRHMPPQVVHPERPARLGAVLNMLRDTEFDRMQFVSAPKAQLHQIARIHPLDHVHKVMASFPQGTGSFYFDADTVAYSGTGEAALRAAGSVIKAVDMVMRGTVDSAFCAVRPPGHHAEPGRVMGFCFFNNIAVGAAYAQEVHGCTRVAVVDFDVHHGNGTQAAFWNRPNAFYASTHQGDFYPGTGHAEETGAFNNIVNIPLHAHAGSTEFRRAYDRVIFPALDAFAPDLLLISAGFDAHKFDPLAQLELEVEDYAWVTEGLCRLASKHCKGRVVSALEGGYDLEALADCVRAHIRVLVLGSQAHQLSA